VSAVHRGNCSAATGSAHGPALAVRAYALGKCDCLHRLHCMCCLCNDWPWAFEHDRVMLWRGVSDGLDVAA
jgi:hypothetical protein